MKELEMKLESIKALTGIELVLCEHFGGMRALASTGERYFNIITNERVSYSLREVNRLQILIKYGIIKRFEPNGVNRVALFI